CPLLFVQLIFRSILFVMPLSIARYMPNFAHNNIGQLRPTLPGVRQKQRKKVKKACKVCMVKHQ
ncbi:hypothetical protein LRR18_18685, partial [Mangrovimonas sp. AS39]|uniref:hypothetical protein n=1 Tax=Mangrovimonas futianensis TaxID=2895523 RepID=UPI001E469164